MLPEHGQVVFVVKCFNALQKCGTTNIRSCRLKTLSKGGMVRGLPPIDHVDLVCDSCMAGKQRRHPFPSASRYHAPHLLDLVHADHHGLITRETPGRKRLSLLVVDDKSCYMWLLLLASKDQAEVAIIQLQARAEAEAGRASWARCALAAAASSPHARSVTTAPSIESNAISPRCTRPNKMVWWGGTTRQC